MRNIISVWLLWMGLASAVAQAVDPVPVEYLWQSDPQLNINWEFQFEIPNIHINAKQLTSSYATERMRAAQSILRVPDSPTLNRDELLSAIVARLESGESDLGVRAELVAAACELDNGTHAALFWKLGSGDRVIQPVVEAACLKWRSAEPLATWRGRLKDTQSSPTLLQLATDGLGGLGSAEDLVALKAIVLDPARSDAVRLSTARAIGSLARDSQLELATQLRKSNGPIRELLAVSVLANAPPESVTAFIQEIAEKSTPVAERAAYEWLCRQDPAIAKSTAKARLKHIDSHVRSLAIDRIAELNSDDTLPALIATLDDPHPSLRDQARLRILGHGSRSPEQLQQVHAQLASILTSESWRPLEQGIRLTVEFQRPEHVPQLVKLLDHSRSEVCITAGWALRHLATDEPGLKAIYDHLTVWCEKLSTWIDKRNDPSTPRFQERDLRRLAHLFEAMGLRRYEAAKPMLLTFVPKDPNRGLITRMTAIWACGRLWENGENKELTDELEVRISDKIGPFPESPSVRFMSTIALGWVADPTTRASLVRWTDEAPSPTFYATEWALKRIDQRAAK